MNASWVIKSVATVPNVSIYQVLINAYVRTDTVAIHTMGFVLQHRRDVPTITNVKLMRNVCSLENVCAHRRSTQIP